MEGQTNFNGTLGIGLEPRDWNIVSSGVSAACHSLAFFLFFPPSFSRDSYSPLFLVRQGMEKMRGVDLIALLVGYKNGNDPR